MYSTYNHLFVLAGGVITSTFPGDLATFTESEKLSFASAYKTILAASSSLIDVADIESVDLEAGSIIATATLKPSVSAATVVQPNSQALICCLLHDRSPNCHPTP